MSIILFIPTKSEENKNFDSWILKHALKFFVLFFFLNTAFVRSDVSKDKLNQSGLMELTTKYYFSQHVQIFAPTLERQ